ncbi:PQQ-dependent dehydrogenase, methanol/ethanol family [Dongia soli]|uniref:PQQ-dependent dehydrogenase, methanol/ethanol family n=1 Tax=Dongia soli TaxID=600628 RepID=A0ABU5EHP2_9PROT|nr:PQQ-dependent dehydrogenase, methanol/ethanol family [Dongia soli]MDY0885675.1 PQQ-dependent dehydrogenase, methanol/ethanol family [Dongia soli]
MQMISKHIFAAVTIVTAVMLATPVAQAGPVSTDDLLKAQDNSAEWLMYGRDYRNWRYSPLSELTPENVAQLHPVWAMSTGGQLGGLESTPLFRDGVLYFSADYARVFAVDARSGNIVWHYEPEYDQGLTAVLCCGPIHRGLAMKDDLVYVARLDAKLVALHRADGKVAWETKIDDWSKGITTNSAPLIVNDHVIIGISGGEFGARGYLKSFNAKTGALEWTTYTIPAPGEPGSDTWPKDDSWKTGGGPTWLTGSYDAATNTLYWGIGNPAPWSTDRIPGDNLWTDCMMALDPDTGKMKWAFQYTPNDAWDYDGMATPILVDLTIDGKPVKAAVVSNRNGFFYAIDRTTGKFIYAFPLVEGINWTSGIDPVTGRPKVNAEMRPKSGGATIQPIVPGLEGGTNWFPPAYDPDLGYFFTSVNQWGMGLTAWEKKKLNYKPGDWYIGVDYQMYRMGDTIGHIKAIDIANKKVVWDVPSSLPLFAGMLVTKGGVLFTGDQRGRFLAYDAKTGKELWKFQTGSGINASPITYQLDGKQYVAVLSGLGGDPSFYYSAPKGGMLWVFAIDGKVQEGSAYNQQVIEKMLPEFKK